MINDDVRHMIKEKSLGDYYEYSLQDIAEKLFMHVNTATSLEKRAIANFKVGLAQRGYKLEDFLL